MSDGRFAGVDWASEAHAVCVVDERGRIVEGRRYRHKEPGIRALCARLVGLRVVLVALERPDGLLIERLLDAGLAVIAVHPNQVKAMRPRSSTAGGKSDSFDSFVLAELARTDSHRFRILVPDSDGTKALRALTRAREDLVRTRVALANQLRDQLACFWPGETAEQLQRSVRFLAAAELELQELGLEAPATCEQRGREAKSGERDARCDCEGHPCG
jgi:transposase